MTAFSDYTELNLLNHLLGGSAFTSPTSVHCALFTSATGDDGSGTECTGNGYARVAASFGAAAAGSISNDADIAFGAPSGGDWGTVTHFALYDAATAGNMLVHGALTAPKVSADGDPMDFPTASLTVTLD